MTDRMKALMASLTVESSDPLQNGPELDITQVGAAEVLVTTDEATTELEESIEDLADAVNEKVETEAVIDKLIDATESLESSLRFIESMEAAGQPLSGAALLAWEHGVRDSFEARQIPTTEYESFLDSVVTSFESNVAGDYTVEAKEAGKGILARIAEMLKKAWEWLRQTMRRLWTQATTSSKKLKEAATKLKEAAGNIKEGGVVTRKVLTGPYKELLVAGKPNPKGVVDQVITAIGSIDKGIASISSSIDSAKGSLASGSANEGVKSPWSDGDKINFVGSGQLVISVKDGKIFKSSKSVSISLSGDTRAAADGPAEPLSKSEIIATADSIIKLAETVEASGKTLAAKFDTNKEFKAGGEGNQELANSIAAALSTVQKIASLVHSESLKVGKKAYTYALQCAKIRGGAKAEKEEKPEGN